MLPDAGHIEVKERVSIVDCRGRFNWHLVIVLVDIKFAELVSQIHRYTLVSYVSVKRKTYVA